MKKQSADKVITREKILIFNNEKAIKDYFDQCKLQQTFKFSSWKTGAKEYFYARCCFCTAYISWSRYFASKDCLYRLIHFGDQHCHPITLNECSTASYDSKFRRYRRRRRPRQLKKNSDRRLSNKISKKPENKKKISKLLDHKRNKTNRLTSRQRQKLESMLYKFLSSKANKGKNFIQSQICIRQVMKYANLTIGSALDFIQNFDKKRKYFAQEEDNLVKIQMNQDQVSIMDEDRNSFYENNFDPEFDYNQSPWNYDSSEM